MGAEAAGFSIDLWGVPEMLQAVKRLVPLDAVVRRLSEDVERLLRFQVGDLFGARAGALKQSAAAAELEVQVTVTHPTDRDSVQLAVPASASMKQVKEALAAKLQQPDITRNGSGTYSRL